MYTKRLIELMKRIEEQKKKFYQKVQTYEALSLTFDRMMQVYEIIWLEASLYTIFTNFFLFAWGMDLTLDPSLFEYLLLDFDFELPSLEEFLRGISIKVSFVDLTEQFKRWYYEYYRELLPPEFQLDWNEAVKQFIKEVYQDNYVAGVYTPARFGVTKYDESVYWKEDLQKTIEGTIKQYLGTTLQDEISNILSKGMMLKEEFVEELYDRSVLINAVIRNAPIMGFVICGYTPLCEEKEIHGVVYGVVKVRLKDLGEVEIYFNSIDDVTYGHLCGISRCGFSRVVPENESLFSEKIFEFIAYRVRRIVERFSSPITSLLFSEGGRAVRGIPYARSTLTWGEKYMLRALIDSLVRSYLARYRLDPFTMNKYVTFVWDYVFSRVAKHRHHEVGLQRVSIDDYDKYMIEKWVRMNLDRNILISLINFIKTWVSYIWRM